LKLGAPVSWVRYASDALERRPEFQVSGFPCFKKVTEMSDCKLFLEVTGMGV
jgi:hypothetical protein